MAQLQLREAIRRAMVEEMRRDDAVFLMGEEVAYYDGAYKVSQGMLAEFGESGSSTRPSPRTASAASASVPPWPDCGPSSRS